MGKPGAYDFVEGTSEQHRLVVDRTRAACLGAWQAYQDMLEAGVAREVARIVLPLSLYSSMYVTINARSLMNFLSLRTKREDSTFPSYPQREIEIVAEQMETAWAALMPVTHAAFDSGWPGGSVTCPACDPGHTSSAAVTTSAAPAMWPLNRGASRTPRATGAAVSCVGCRPSPVACRGARPSRRRWVPSPHA